MDSQTRRAAALIAAALLFGRGIGTGPEDVERLAERFEKFIEKASERPTW
jgi:hypothetical protein